MCCILANDHTLLARLRGSMSFTYWCTFSSKRGTCGVLEMRGELGTRWGGGGGCIHQQYDRTCTHPPTNTYTHPSTCIHHVYVCIYMCVCIYMYTHTQTHTHTHTQVHTPTPTHPPTTHTPQHHTSGLWNNAFCSARLILLDADASR